MAKMSSVFLGFLLTLVVYLFFGRYEFWGLLIVGFIVGYIAHEGWDSLSDTWLTKEYSEECGMQHLQEHSEQ